MEIQIDENRLQIPLINHIAMSPTFLVLRQASGEQIETEAKYLRIKSCETEQGVYDFINENALKIITQGFYSFQGGKYVLRYALLSNDERTAIFETILKIDKEKNNNG